MITFKVGDIFSEEVEAIVNPVNCVGVSGAGLALAFRKRYPDNYEAYRSACFDNECSVGKVFTFQNDVGISPEYIINFPTKNHYRDASDLSYIHKGMISLCNEIERLNLLTIAMPALGCGLGGLKWNEVRPVITKYILKYEHRHIVVLNPSR